MMMTFSAAAYIVDRLDPHAAKSPSEAEIESSGLTSPQSADEPSREQALPTWFQRHVWGFRGRQAAEPGGVAV
jgi:hypothetical protein